MTKEMTKGITKGIRKGTVPNCFSFHHIRDSKGPVQDLSVVLMLFMIKIGIKNFY